VNLLLFNNRIYGLTKGQYSPTSEVGKVTKSTPAGSVDHPFEPIALALGADASFVARTVDVETKHLQEIVKRAHAHKGGAFVEILQNCNVFNDGAFSDLTEKDRKAEHTLVLEHGKPLIFGKARDKGNRRRDYRPEVVTLGDGIGEQDLIVHDETNPALAYLLSRMGPPAFPTPIGVFTAVERPCYEEALGAQVAAAKQKKPGDLRALLNAGETWVVS
jgi:2-oxoglutarate ferredoxin oxidoreductase subunit beta